MEAQESLRELNVIGAAVAPLASEKNADGTQKFRRELVKLSHGE